MSYYNLSCILDKKIIKIFFSPNEPITTEEKEILSETTSTYISNSLFDFLSRFKEQIELSAEAWDTIKNIQIHMNSFILLFLAVNFLLVN